MRIGDMEDMEGYKLAYGSEGVGNDGVRGVKIFVKRYPETVKRLLALDDDKTKSRPGRTPKEKEGGLFYDVGAQVERILSDQTARLNPATWEREAKTKADFAKAFADAGLGPIFMEPIPNEYYPTAIGDPWYNVATPIGYIKIGWRKRVINIDWTRTILMSLVEDKYREEPRPPGGEELLPDIIKSGETTTLGDYFVHAYGYEKATKYLKAMFEHSQKAGGTRKLEPPKPEARAR